MEHSVAASVGFLQLKCENTAFSQKIWNFRKNFENAAKPGFRPSSAIKKLSRARMRRSLAQTLFPFHIFWPLRLALVFCSRFGLGGASLGWGAASLLFLLLVCCVSTNRNINYNYYYFKYCALQFPRSATPKTMFASALNMFCIAWQLMCCFTTPTTMLIHTKNRLLSCILHPHL